MNNNNNITTPDRRLTEREVPVVSLDCNIVVCEFELQWRCYVHFRTNTPGKSMNPPIPLL